MEEKNIFILTPMSQKISLEAGQTHSGSITIANPYNSINELIYKVEVAPYSIKDENYVADFLSDSDRTRIVDWITIENPTGTVAPGEKVEVKYTIQVPEGAPAGGQYAAFMVSSDNDEAADDGIMIKSILEMASILYAEVDGEYVRKGEITGIEMPGFVVKTPIGINSLFKNEGNVHETAKISFEVRNAILGDLVYPRTKGEGVYEEIIMPESTLYVTHEIYEVPPLGVYDVSQTIEYMGETYNASQMVVACPIWFMALLIVTIIVSIASIIMSTRRRRLKKNVF